MLEEGPQAKRTRELIKKHTSFRFMPQQDKSRIIHICGILSYLEIAELQKMTVAQCVKGIKDLLVKVTEKYAGKDKDTGNVIITD